jgi:hypothetical protein
MKGSENQQQQKTKFLFFKMRLMPESTPEERRAISMG